MTTRTYSSFNPVTAMIAALVSSATLVAVAGPVRAEPVSIGVSTAGIDLSTAAGRATMDQRIARAARKVCFQLGDERDASRAAAAAKCRDQAVTDARVQVARIIDQRVQTAMADAR